jgi:hypothetical protein
MPGARKHNGPRPQPLPLQRTCSSRPTFFSKDRTHTLLTSGSLADARIVYAAHHPQRSLTERATYPAERPRWPLDSVLGSLDLAPEQVKVIGAPASDQPSDLSSDLPSDHLGLFVRLKLLRDDEAQEQSRTWYTRLCERRLADDFACRPTELAAH